MWSVLREEWRVNEFARPPGQATRSSVRVLSFKRVSLIKCVLRTDTLADIYLRTDFIDKSQGITRPRQHPDSPNRRDRFAAQASYPSHIGKTIGHLDK